MKQTPQRAASPTRKGILLFLLFLCLPGFAGFEADSLRADPIRILEVDSSAYPRIRLRVALRSPHPSFVQESGSSPASLAPEFSEIYNQKELTPKGIHTKDNPKSAGRLNAIFVLDATRSVSKRDFRRFRALAQDLIRGLGPRDRSAIYALRGRPELVADVSSQHEAQAQKAAAIKRTGQRTRLYDSLYSALYTAHSLAHSNPEDAFDKTLVLLFTDAKEEDSFLSDNDCFELTKLGSELSIPVFVVLSDGSPAKPDSKTKSPKKTNKSQENKANLIRARLKRIALKTGGEVWSLFESQKPGAQKFLERLKQRHTQIRELSWTSPHFAEGAWPGDPILIRASLQSGETSYKALASYRVPFGAWLRSKYGNSAFLIAAVVVALSFFLVVLLLLVVLITLWLRRAKELSGHKAASRDSLSTATEGDGLSNLDQITDFMDGAQGARLHSRAASVSSDELGSAEEAGVIPTEAQATAMHPAAALMEDERRLYMREYNYRMLQLALREAGKYDEAALVAIRTTDKKEGRRYDLFLESTVLGSGRWANIPLHDNTISPIHAKIKRVDSRYVLYDMLSAGGVYRNGKKLLRPRGLRDGDEIRIGRNLFRFEGSTSPT